MSVPKEYKMVVKNEIPNKKYQILSDSETKFQQRVRFQIKFFTTRQILKHNFHNVSDFKSKISQCVRFCFGKTFQKSDFAQKCAFTKSRFD